MGPCRNLTPPQHGTYRPPARCCARKTPTRGLDWGREMSNRPGRAHGATRQPAADRPRGPQLDRGFPPALQATRALPARGCSHAGPIPTAPRAGRTDLPQHRRPAPHHSRSYRLSPGPTSGGRSGTRRGRSSAP